MLYKDELSIGRMEASGGGTQLVRQGVEAGHGSEKDKLDCMSYCSMNNGRPPEQTKQEVKLDKKHRIDEAKGTKYQFYLQSRTIS